MSRRLPFSARLAGVLVILGALIAGVATLVPLAAQSTQARQTALDFAADRAASSLGLLAAEEQSLEGFATQTAGQVGATADAGAFLDRLSSAAGVDDVIALADGRGVVGARNGAPTPQVAWLQGLPSSSPLPGAASRTGVEADPRGQPWILASASVPGSVDGRVIVARPLADAAMIRLEARQPGQNLGFFVARAGTVTTTGAVDGRTVVAGTAVPDAFRGVLAADGPGTIVRAEDGDAAAVSAAIGGGYREFVSVAVSQDTSILGGIALPVILLASALILMGLVAVFVLIQRDLRQPLQRLDLAVAALARDDFGVPVPTGRDDEIGRLAGSFETMRAELRAMLRGAEARAAIATDLSALTPLPVALEAVCRRLREESGASGAVVVLDQQPAIVYAEGIEVPESARAALLVGEGPLGCATRLGGPVALHACALPGSTEAELGMREIVAAPLKMSAMTAGVVAVFGPDGRFTRHDSELIAVVAEQVALGLERDRVLEAARALANTDGLTGLHNRRFLTAYLDQQLAVADRSGEPLTLLMLDIDHFKAINDTYGHEVGDLALCRVGETLASTLRRSDLTARLGGDEFVVVMTGTTVEGAVVLAEALRKEVSRIRLAAGEPPRRVRLTVSIGVATRVTPGAGVDRLLTVADNALYAAKRGGRDRVHVAVQDLPPAAP